MTDDLKPYPAYKESSVPWLEKVPEHWNISRVKNYFRETDTRSLNGNGVLLSLTRGRGLIPQSEASKKLASAEDLSKYKVCQPGNLVMNRMQAWSGMFAVANQEGLVSPDYSVFRITSDSRVRFFEALFKTPKLINEFSKSSKGIGSGFNRLYTPDFGAIHIPVPSHSEQGAIVRYLDHLDRNINSLIRAKKKQIGLLNEQKQAIIHNAVTRGIDPSIRLKTSGAIWLGNIPPHWGLRRISGIFVERNQTGQPELPILAVSIANGVTRSTDIDEDGRPKRLIEDRTRYKVAHEGDIAYNMMRMWQGAVGVVPEKGLISPAYVVAKPLAGVNTTYYSLLFRTAACKGEIISRSRGIVDDRNRLYWDSFKVLPVPFPPEGEQKDIVDWVTARTEPITAGETKLNEGIAHLREYRTRLVTDVVTGKLDVRAAAAKLPDVSREVEPLDEVDDVLQDESAAEAEMEEVAEAA